MHKKLMASAATGFLLLGAAGVAMAQEEGVQLVVFGVQTTSNIELDPPIAVDDPCADAVSALRTARPPLRQQEVSVVDQTFLVFVFTRAGAGRGAATLVCAPEGTEVPAPAPT
jgi:hypothetical protein